MCCPDVTLYTGAVNLVHNHRRLFQYDLAVETGIGLGDDHVGKVSFQVFVHKISRRVRIESGNPVPLVENLQSEVARPGMYGERKAPVSLVVFHKMVAAADGADGFVEHPLVHADGTDPVFQLTLSRKFEMIDEPAGRLARTA